jgi:hypothetical protein
MIRLQGRAVVYGEVWFEEQPPPDAAVDILVYRHRQEPVAGAHTSVHRTARTDLARSTEDIISEFSNSCRYQIRRADARDALRCEVFLEPTERLAEFIEFFDLFAQQKGIWPADRHWLARVASEGQLVLSAALHGGRAIVWHAHLRSCQTAMLAHSASLFRGLDERAQALIGRANRWLHWQDMLRFKELGATWYDWGGLFDDESADDRAGINRFKTSFNCAPMETYDCVVPLSWRGRVWLPMRNAWRRHGTETRRPSPATPAARPLTESVGGDP